MESTCYLFVSLLSHFWLINFCNLHLIYQPYVGLCQTTCIQSHKRQSRSAVVIATCEVQVSATDSQTVPTVATGVSKQLCCRLTLIFTPTSEILSLYITLLFYWSFYNYAAHTVDILVPITVVQGVDNQRWGLYCRRWHCICVGWGHSSRILPFSRRLGQRNKHSPNQGWESTRRLPHHDILNEVSCHLFMVMTYSWVRKHGKLGKMRLCHQGPFQQTENT